MRCCTLRAAFTFSDALPFVQLKRHWVFWSSVQKQGSGTLRTYLCALELLSALIFPAMWVVGSSQLEKHLLGPDLIKFLTLAAVCCPWDSCKWLGLNGVLGDPNFSSCTPFFILKVSSLSQRAVSKHVRKTFSAWFLVCFSLSLMRLSKMSPCLSQCL